MPCPFLLAAPGRGIGKAQAKTSEGGPDADPLALLDHGHDFSSGRVPQGLNDLEDDRVAERRIGRIEIAFAHHSFRQLPRVELTVGFQMAHANIRDLAFLKEAMTDDVLGSVSFAAFEQADRSIDVREIMPGLGNLRLIGGDRAADLSAFLL